MIPNELPSSDRPLVSIITPVLNGERYLAEALQSVRDQDYAEIEHIVVDGGSTDSTLRILRDHESRSLSWTTGKDSGPAEAINKGIALAKGSVLSWLNYDDVLLPGAVTAVVRALETNASLQFTYGHSQLIGEDGRITKNLYTCRQTPASYRHDGGNIFQGTVFFTREAWRECGPLDETLQCAFEYKLFDQFFARFGGAFLNWKLARYRIHGESISSRMSDRFAVEVATFRKKRPSKILRNAYRVRRIALNLIDGNLPLKFANR